MIVFEPNTTVPYTAFHLPADGSYTILPGCADLAIKRPHASADRITETVCPTGSRGTCIARWS